MRDPQFAEVKRSPRREGFFSHHNYSPTTARLRP
jgi:hypothetical protein